MMNNLSQISSLTIVSDCSGFSFLGWGQGRGGNVWVPVQKLAPGLEPLPWESNCCWG